MPWNQTRDKFPVYSFVNSLSVFKIKSRLWGLALFTISWTCDSVMLLVAKYLFPIWKQQSIT